MASLLIPSLESEFRQQKLFESDKFEPLALRERVEKLSRKSKSHHNVKALPVDVDSVSAEWLIPLNAPPDRVLFYIHGGAWFMGSTNTHRAFVSTLAFKSGIHALNINYRLAPENPFPAGLEDCIATYEWLLRSGILSDKIVVAGDSAGGNLALALLVSLRYSRKPMPAGVVCLSPTIDLTGSGFSKITKEHPDPYFKGMGSNTILQDYIQGRDPRNPLISPIYADLRGFPPILIHVGEREIMEVDAMRFNERALAAGVDIKTVIWPKMFHGFQISASLSPEAEQAFDQIAEFLTTHLDIK